MAGVADAVRAAGVPCFGPSREAAQLEGSKTFAKRVMAEAGVPTAASVTLDGRRQPRSRTWRPSRRRTSSRPTGSPPARACTSAATWRWRRTSPATCWPRRARRAWSRTYLDGPEVSLFAVTDGTTVVPLLPAQDHKRVGDGDTGPNTGGMGAYAPLPWLPPGTVAEVQRTVLQPVVDRMRERGTPFAGLLYAGLAMTSRGPQVVEFNARFGDPETQAVLALLETPLGRAAAGRRDGDAGGAPAAGAGATARP